MITLITELDAELKEEIVRFCEKSCLGMKAVGPMLSYGTQYDFVLNYVRRDEQGFINAFISRYYGSVTVAAAEASMSASDIEELAGFLSVTGYSALTAPPAIMEALGIEDAETGFVMTYDKGADCVANTFDGNATILANDGYREFFDAICRNNPGYIPSGYEDWLVDISHRVRHNTAEIFGLYKDERDECISTVAALVFVNRTVFMGAVSTDPRFRGQHLASTIIKYLCDRYSDSTVYLMCKPEKKAFYEKLGMHAAGEYSEYCSSQK